MVIIVIFNLKIFIYKAHQSKKNQKMWEITQKTPCIQLSQKDDKLHGQNNH